MTQTGSNISNQLQQIGLTELEARVYLYFLEEGSTKVTKAHKDLSMDKSSTYRIVENLVNQGLLAATGEKYGKEFIANDPKVLLEISKEKQVNLKVASRAISSFVNNLTDDIASKYKKHNISVFEGQDSYIKAMNKRLEVSKSPIREISNPKEPHDNYWIYIDDFIRKRVEKKLHLKCLIPADKVEQKYEQSDRKLLKEVRILPDAFKSKSMFATFGDYSTFNNIKGDRLFGIIIKDKLITDLMNNMFDVIWSISKENKPI